MLPDAWGKCLNEDTVTNGGDEEASGGFCRFPFLFNEKYDIFARTLCLMVCTKL